MPADLKAQPRVAVAFSLSHRTSYTPEEEHAFRHGRHYLGRYDKFVVVPESHRAAYPGLMVKRFPDRFFGSARAHASLLLSRRFYRAFLPYDFVLVHHLDALVFSDQLAEWCAAGYDYIGAPWLISPDTPHITEQKVGNGGLSLRRVRSFLRVLESRQYFIDPDDYWKRYAARTRGLVRLLNRPRKYLKRLLPLNDVRWHIRWALRGDVHEDRFWSEYATHYDAAFRIAPVDVAMRFAFEAEPRKCFERIGRHMPFGAHRWQMFDRAFYEPYLLRDGVGSGVHPGVAGPARAGSDFESDARSLARRAAVWLVRS
jgi:hypothetical protein